MKGEEGRGALWWLWDPCGRKVRWSPFPPRPKTDFGPTKYPKFHPQQGPHWSELGAHINTHNGSLFGGMGSLKLDGSRLRVNGALNIRQVPKSISTGTSTSRKILGTFLFSFFVRAMGFPPKKKKSWPKSDEVLVLEGVTLGTHRHPPPLLGQSLGTCLLFTSCNSFIYRKVWFAVCFVGMKPFRPIRTIVELRDIG